MKMTFETKEYEYDDDIVIIKQDGKKVFCGLVDSLDEDLEEELEVSFDDVFDCWDSETKTYKYEDLELIILDI